MKDGPFESIELRGIRAWGRHGANAGEQDVPQPLEIDLSLSADVHEARTSDALADTIDYADLHARIVRIVETERHRLLERLGASILDAVMADKRIAMAAVSVAKPRPAGRRDAGRHADEDAAAQARRCARIGQEKALMRAAVGIGSNVGDAVANVRRAFDRLTEVGAVVVRSRLYRTPPWGVVDQAPFVNAAALVETALDPRALLAALKRIELEEGREATVRWGPRVLDLDILTYGDVRMDDPDLVIPHARLHERAFALVPLAEIDPSFAGLCDALPPGERAAVVELAPQ